MHRAARAAILASFLLAVTPAQAEERVKVRIGMSMSQIEPYLTSQCTNLIIGGDKGGEQYITCELPEGRLITANLSPKDRITYSVYREINDALTAAEFGAAIAAELGFAGAGEPCMIYSDASLCWSKGTTRLWVYLSPDGSGRLSSFQNDEAMAAEDGN
ncbi:MAG: hypothetical protein Q8O63_11795 [Hoeflea sp.]|nr:hypothetical protein [Hoeflea sp.]